MQGTNQPQTQSRQVVLVEDGGIVRDRFGVEQFISVEAARQLILASQTPQKQSNTPWLAIAVAGVVVVIVLLLAKPQQPVVVMPNGATASTSVTDGGQYLATQDHIRDLQTQLMQKEHELSTLRAEAMRNTAASEADKSNIATLQDQLSQLRQQLEVTQTQLREAQKGTLQRLGEAIFGQ